MFKYKSPLQRILNEDVDYADAQEEAPVTNLAALRSVLSGETAKAEQADVEFEKVLELAADDMVEEEREADVPSEFAADVQPEEETAPAAEAIDAKPASVEEVPEAAMSRRRRKPRVKTTFLGYERSDNGVQSLLESEPAAAPSSSQASFPVGWLVVTQGPGRGASITLVEGLMQMGRNDDQAIQLDFGDHGISRENHAVIAYDAETRKCYLGHGGKANLVRLNGSPVLSTVPLSAGDTIRISDTTMQFMPFCDEAFDWRTE
ncbi:FHA domain-containing protein [Aliiroseovarius halocynthiae]|uniref:FHA domain-containing protein n=1 Tax=Aliiroseovarius halocynthiae TaxID=985055 RepID=A0A545SQL6_9RHOB|nr:FHA domain-containing protein [Aliiroseovarius halocynthiae]TQV67166.1 FHA domain-containing protein [Aliiroseovarius halocynthiae]SMR82103.1 FHA domain-containing protein [Aliiroseovarius halocynthiae]